MFSLRGKVVIVTRICGLLAKSRFLALIGVATQVNNAYTFQSSFDISLYELKKEHFFISPNIIIKKVKDAIQDKFAKIDSTFHLDSIKDIFENLLFSRNNSSFLIGASWIEGERETCI